MHEDVDSQYWRTYSQKTSENYIKRYVDCAKQNSRLFQKLEIEQVAIMSAADKALERSDYAAVLEIEKWLWSGGGRWLDLRGHTQDGILLLEQAIEAARRSGSRRREQHLLGELGRAWMKLEDEARAERYFAQALKIANEVEDQAGAASHLGNLGELALSRGVKGKAEEHFREALSLAQEIGDRQLEGRLTASLATLRLTRGELTLDNFEQLMDSFEKCLEIAREVEDLQGEASHLGCLGLAWEMLAAGLYEEPRLIQGPYLSEFERRQQEYEARTRHYREARGDYSQALDYYKRALTVAREAGDWQLEKQFEESLDRVGTRIHPIVRARQVTLKTAHRKGGEQRYVTAMHERNRWVLRAETTVQREWEQLTLLCLHNGKVALKTYHGRYVTALNDENYRDWRLIAETNELQAWEMFDLVNPETEVGLACIDVLERLEQGSVTVALRTHHGRYVRALNDERNRDWVLKGRSQTLGVWETFTVSLAHSSR